MMLPKRPLYDHEITEYIKKLKKYLISEFSCVTACQHILNPNVTNVLLQIQTVEEIKVHIGQHIEKRDIVEYFDSFGNLKLPKELVTYFGRGVTISYNNERYQQFTEENCGHLYIEFLNKTI